MDSMGRNGEKGGTKEGGVRKTPRAEVEKRGDMHGPSMNGVALLRHMGLRGSGVCPRCLRHCLDRLSTFPRTQRRSKLLLPRQPSMTPDLANVTQSVYQQGLITNVLCIIRESFSSSLFPSLPDDLESHTHTHPSPSLKLNILI